MDIEWIVDRVRASKASRHSRRLRQLRIMAAAWLEPLVTDEYQSTRISQDLQKCGVWHNASVEPSDPILTMALETMSSQLFCKASPLVIVSADDKHLDGIECYINGLGEKWSCGWGGECSWEAMTRYFLFSTSPRECRQELCLLERSLVLVGSSGDRWLQTISGKYLKMRLEPRAIAKERMPIRQIRDIAIILSSLLEHLSKRSQEAMLMSGDTAKISSI